MKLLYYFEFIKIIVVIKYLNMEKVFRVRKLVPWTSYVRGERDW